VGRGWERLVQSPDSKSEGKGCVRQRERVDNYCPGHRLQKKTAGTMVPLVVSSLKKYFHIFAIHRYMIFNNEPKI